MGELAGIDCRPSLVRFGDTTKVGEQARICLDSADHRGWTVPQEVIWKDNPENIIPTRLPMAHITDHATQTYRDVA